MTAREATDTEWSDFVARARSPETRAKLAAGAATFTDRDGTRYRAPAAVLTRSGGHAPEFCIGQPIATAEQFPRLESLNTARQLGVDLAATRATERITAGDDDLEATIARSLGLPAELVFGATEEPTALPTPASHGSCRTGGDELEESIQRSLRGEP